jgi:hypothetical protein
MNKETTKDMTKDVVQETTGPKVRAKRKLRKRTVVLIVLLLCVLAVGGIGYAFKSKLMGPSVGKVVTTLPSAQRQAQVELAQFDGTNFSFVHPITYIEQTTKQPPVPNEIESHIFISSGMVSRVLTTAVTKFPSGKFDDDPSYYMRAQNSAKYTMKTTVVKNEKVVIFTDANNQQYQQAAFWAHGGKLLTFTMTGVSTDIPAMTAEYNDMVNSISWR